jgi:carboxypeptidase Taq
MSTDSGGDPDPDADTDDPEDAYDALEQRVRKITHVADAGGLLRWDQQVMMPAEGTPARSKQRSALDSVGHELLTADETGRLLDALEGAAVDDDRGAVVREVRRRYDRETRVPRELVEELSEATANADPAWREARANDDFSTFEPHLERLVELKREYAEAIDPDADPYAVLFADYEPYLGLDAPERILDRLAEELPPMIETIAAEGRDLATPFEGEFDVDTQEALSRDALDLVGYDWDRGRLDTAPHPFSLGTQFDARVTTRFDPEDPLGALTSTIHEFGHASYTLGLPDDHYGTPLGEARSSAVHESQSRFWENHVGRTLPFWERFLPRMHERFPSTDHVTPREAYEAANRIDPENLIRVEADELTYHLHVVVRFEVERALVEGEIDVSEVPQVWNDKYEQYLGVRPDSDADGCLQDVHWSIGLVGHFSTYTLGSMLAAQLDAAMREDLDVDALIRAGELDRIYDWQTEHVHRHGQRYPTDELVREATGEDLTADHFLEYAREKFSDLYDVDL